MRKLRELWQDQSGVAPLEYALLLMTIVGTGLMTWSVLGGVVEGLLRRATAAWP